MASSSQQPPVDHKKRQVIHSQAQNVINQVITVCKREASTKFVEFTLMQVYERVANYTGVSRRTISRISKESRMNRGEPLDSPRTAHSNPKKADIDSFDREIIRRIIRDFYLVQKKPPTLRTLLPVVKANINFPWQRTFFWLTLKSMGFYWRRQNRRKLLAEYPDIVNRRAKYLQQIKSFRKEKRSIFYLDERWIDSNLTFRKCWQTEGIAGITTTINLTNRVIIIHLGNENGFLQDAAFIFQSGSSSSNYRNQMNDENFEEWLKEKVLPKLPPNSVLVMDNAPYHEKLAEKVPTEYNTKDEMIAWLLKKAIPCDKSMRKDVLIDLIETYKPEEKLFRIDQILKAEGHDVLKLPPNICDLNPIEFAWAKVEKIIRGWVCEWDMKPQYLREVTAEALNSITLNDWQGYFKRVIEIEQHYLDYDGLMEDCIDELINSQDNRYSEEEDEDNEDEMN